MIDRTDAPFRRSAVFARTGSFLVLGIAALALVHHALGVGVRPDWWPGEPPRLDSALGLMALGIAMAAQSSQWVEAQRIRMVAATSGLALGLVGLAYHATEEVEFVHPGEMVASGRMALVTALCLTLYGTSLLALPQDGRRFRHLIAESCAVFAMFASVAVLFGYTCGGLHLRDYMQPGTAVGLTIVGLGILAIRPEHGHMLWLLRRTTAGSLARRQLLALAILLPVLKWSRRAAERLDWFDARLGDAIESVLFLVVLGAGVTWTTRRLQTALDQRQEVEVTLRQQEARFRRMVESDLLGVVICAMDGRVVYANDLLLAMLGSTREDVDAGRLNWRELTPPRWRTRDEQARAEMRAGDGSCRPYEKEYLRKDGGTVAVLVGFAYVDATFSEAVGFVLDISARKETEAALRDASLELESRVAARTADLARANAALEHDIAERQRIDQALIESEQRLRAATESTYDAVVTLDSQGRVLSWNLAAERTFGYRAEEMLGQTLQRLVPKRRQAEYEQKLAAMRTGGSPGQPSSRSEGVAIRRDGGEVEIEASLSSWLAQGACFHSAILRDITDRKAIETALTQARDHAELASRFKSTFLANMSHEIRTPMNVLLGMAELLARSQLDDEQRRYARAARQAGEHLIAVVDDVLDFSKVESGHFQVEHAPFSPRDVVEQTIEFFSHRAHQKRLALAAAVDDAVPDQLIGDAHRLRQVLVNLVGNAVKFTEHGGVTLDMQWGADGLLYVGVADTGIGVPTEKHLSIFEAFTQVDDSSTRLHGGAGLGLSICKRIVERMGGRIWLDSELGQGSVFHFTARLPEVQRAASVEGGAGSVADAEATARSLDAPALTSHQPVATAIDPAKEVKERLRTGAVLVADSNPVHRKSVRDALVRMGARVHEAEDLDSSMRLLRGEVRHAFVIVDSQLPPEGGLALARKLRDELPAPWPAVVLARSDEDSLDISRMNEAGVISTLRKPVKRRFLADALAVAVMPEDAPADLVGRKQTQRNLTILVVDDAPDNRMLVRAFLQDQGWFVEEAENGEAAVRQWRPGRFDVVLMDVHMPVMDGHMATREMRRLEREGGWTPTAIVALTAHALPEARAQSMAAGCTDHMTKPFRRGQLVDLVRSLVSPVPRSREPPPPLSTAELLRTRGTGTGQGDVVAEPKPDEARIRVVVDPLVHSLVPDFLAQRQADVLVLQDAMERQDFARIHLLGHSMKGSGGSYGFDAITDIGCDIEAAARVQDAAAIAAATVRLASYLAQVEVVSA